MSRADHLQWCKDRAMEYVNTGDSTNAIASMISDLGKHPETAQSASLGMMLAIVINRNDKAAMTNWVQGFN